MCSVLVNQGNCPGMTERLLAVEKSISSNKINILFANSPDLIFSSVFLHS